MTSTVLTGTGNWKALGPCTHTKLLTETRKTLLNSTPLLVTCWLLLYFFVTNRNSTRKKAIMVTMMMPSFMSRSPTYVMMTLVCYSVFMCLFSTVMYNPIPSLTTTTSSTTTSTTQAIVAATSRRTAAIPSNTHTPSPSSVSFSLTSWTASFDQQVTKEKEIKEEAIQLYEHSKPELVTTTTTTTTTPSKAASTLESSTGKKKKTSFFRRGTKAGATETGTAGAPPQVKANIYDGTTPLVPMYAESSLLGGSKEKSQQTKPYPVYSVFSVHNEHDDNLAASTKKSKDDEFAFIPTTITQLDVEQVRTMYKRGKINITSEDERILTIANVYDTVRHPFFNRTHYHSYYELSNLMSHLNAVLHAYNKGYDVAFFVRDEQTRKELFVKDSAINPNSTSNAHDFHKYWKEHVSVAPPNWKSLQFISTNQIVNEHMSNTHDPWINWFPEHSNKDHASKLYMLCRNGMKAVLDEFYDFDKKIWKLSFGIVTIDEAIFFVTKEAYTSTYPWTVDQFEKQSIEVNNELSSSSSSSTPVTSTAAVSAAFDGKVQYVPEIQLQSPFSPQERLRMKHEKLVSPGKYYQSRNETVIVVQTVRLKSVEVMETEIRRVKSDITFLQWYHTKPCEWHVHVVFTTDELQQQWVERTQDAIFQTPNIHFHMYVFTKSFNKYYLINNTVPIMKDFDHLLLKDNDMRIAGIPWYTFMETKGNAVISQTVRQTRHHSLKQNENKYMHDDTAYPMEEGKDYHNPGIYMSRRYRTMTPIQMPLLEQYLALFDGKFATWFFDTIFTTSVYLNQRSDWGVDSSWCIAAEKYPLNNGTRTPCNLVLSMAVHDDGNQLAANQDYFSSGKRMMEWFMVQFKHWVLNQGAVGGTLLWRELWETEEDCINVFGGLENYSIDQCLRESMFGNCNGGLRELAAVKRSKDQQLQFSNGITKIGHVAYFNSFANPLRRDFMESWLSKLSVPYLRLEALANSEHNNKDLEDYYKKKNKKKVKNGITRSHMGLLSKVGEFHKGATLVLHDDSTKIENMARLELALSELPPTWDVVRLNCQGGSTHGSEGDDRTWFRVGDKSNHNDEEGENNEVCIKSSATIYRDQGALSMLYTMIPSTLDADMDCLLSRAQCGREVYCLDINTQHEIITKSSPLIQKEEPNHQIFDTIFLNSWSEWIPMEQIQEEIEKTKKEIEKKDNNKDTTKDSSKKISYNYGHIGLNSNTRIGKIIYHNKPKDKLRKQYMESWLDDQSVPHQRNELQVPDMSKKTKSGNDGSSLCKKKVKDHCQSVMGKSKSLMRTLQGIKKEQGTGLVKNAPLPPPSGTGKYGTTLLLDDNISPVDGGLDRMEAALQLVPDDWEIIRFDCWGISDFNFEWVNKYVLDVSEYKKEEHCMWKDNTCGSDLKKRCEEKLAGDGWCAASNKGVFSGGSHALLVRDTTTHLRSIDKLVNTWRTQPYDFVDKVIGGRGWLRSYCVNIGALQQVILDGEKNSTLTENVGFWYIDEDDPTTATTTATTKESVKTKKR